MDYTDNQIEIHPLTARNWNDFVKLMGPGGCGGCWCMWLRTDHDTFKKQKGEKNKSEMKKIVKSGIIPGLIAYKNKIPIGWCSVGRKSQYLYLPKTKDDDGRCWSIVCFFIKYNCRQKGIMKILIKQALDYAANNGGKTIEAYPIETGDERISSGWSWHGIAKSFRDAGFIDCEKQSSNRILMRYRIDH